MRSAGNSALTVVFSHAGECERRNSLTIAITFNASHDFRERYSFFAGSLRLIIFSNGPKLFEIFKNFFVVIDAYDYSNFLAFFVGQELRWLGHDFEETIRSNRSYRKSTPGLGRRQDVLIG